MSRPASILRALAAGVHPADLPRARSLGRGCQREAWRVGPFVVKANTPAYSSSENPTLPTRAPLTIPRAVFARLRLAAPTCWYVQTWIVMPFYRTLSYAAFALRLPVKERGARQYHRGKWLDISAANCGVDARGVLHAFDW